MARPMVGFRVANEDVKVVLVGMAKARGQSLSDLVRAAIFHYVDCRVPLSTSTFPLGGELNDHDRNDQ